MCSGILFLIFLVLGLVCLGKALKAIISGKLNSANGDVYYDIEPAGFILRVIGLLLLSVILLGAVYFAISRLYFRSDSEPANSNISVTNTQTSPTPYVSLSDSNKSNTSTNSSNSVPSTNVTAAKKSKKRDAQKTEPTYESKYEPRYETRYVPCTCSYRGGVLVSKSHPDCICSR